MPERVLFFAYYALSFTVVPLGLLLTIYGRHATRTAGLAVLGVAVLLTAVPVGPVLGGRVRRRKRAGSGSASD